MRIFFIVLFACALGAGEADTSIVNNVRSLRAFKIVSEETNADAHARTSTNPYNPPDEN